MRFTSKAEFISTAETEWERLLAHLEDQEKKRIT
jgi:hypothetical protein